MRTLRLFAPPAFWVMPETAVAADSGMSAAIAVTRALGASADPGNDQVAAFMCDQLAASLPRAVQVTVTGGHTALANVRDEFLAKWRAFIETSRAP